MGKRSYVISILLISAALITLLQSRALISPYIIAAIFALYCLGKNHNAAAVGKSRGFRIITAVSFICAVFITLANYSIWLHPRMPDVRSSLFVRTVKLSYILIIMAGTFLSVYNILTFVSRNRDTILYTPPAEGRKRTWPFFVVPFAVILLVYMTVYFCCYYPGLLSPDSVDQVTQTFTKEYSNHQPFYHTLIIGMFLKLGLALFGEINAAVATYVVFQICFMAAAFAFVIHNMARLRLPLWTAVAATAWYALMPFHIMFSFTVWKDVFFGAFVTLLIIFFIRLERGIGNRICSYIGFAVSGLIMCLIRSNGLFAYVFVLLGIVLLARQQKQLIFIMLATVVVSFVMKHSVLTALSVTAPDTVESLSIPLQQIARVAADNGTFTSEDEQLLSQILDLPDLADTYDPTISDPVKNMIRDFGNEDYLKENLGEYAKLYVRTFIHNPMSYVTAWVDSTCGYWNSGYNYWIWYWDVEYNKYGIARTVMSEGMLRAVEEYQWLYYNNDIFMIFAATGLFFWIVLLLTAICISAGNRTGIIACVPILAIVLSLLVSSPVYAEFRYVYALYCALPMLIAISLIKDKEA